MSAAHVWTAVLPIKLVSEANRPSAEHWATKRRRVVEHQKAALMVPKGLPLPCTVEMIRLMPPQAKSMDRHDNLPSACKALVDGIAARLGVDDADPRVSWSYDQERAAEHGVRVTITSEVEA